MAYHFVLSKSPSELAKTRDLLSSSQLVMDKHVSETYNLYDDDLLVGTVSIHENVIKMIAIHHGRQGEQLTGLLLHHVMRIFEEKQINKYFIYTKPENKHLFISYPFSVVSETSHVLLLENKLYPIKDHLLSLKLTLKPRHGEKAAIVMNCNPMTKGHLYLIETCAKEMGDVIIFLVEENKSVFPYDVRFNLVKKATKHLKNVHVLPSTPYIISAATFPTYFMKEVSEASSRYMELDIKIFKDYFFPMFELSYRYVGTEPNDEATSTYNKTMKTILGDKLKIVERKKHETEIISASHVRELMRQKKYRDIKVLVPRVTYKYLMSKEGKALFHA